MLDAELRQDFATLRANQSKAAAPITAASAAGWTEAQLRDAYTRGLAAWRKPDAEGAACASCHTPDAIDLAVIG